VTHLVRDSAPFVQFVNPSHPILTQFNQLHIFTSQLVYILFKSALPSFSTSTKVFKQKLYGYFLSFHTWYIRVSYTPKFPQPFWQIYMKNTIISFFLRHWLTFCILYITLQQLHSVSLNHEWDNKPCINLNIKEIILCAFVFNLSKRASDNHAVS
jgi:hypothetical protein